MIDLGNPPNRGVKGGPKLIAVAKQFGFVGVQELAGDLHKVD
jgi:hypothetical protein